jgi:hypothetical protein
MNQLLVDSMPTLITQPGLTATSITSISLGWNTWASLDDITGWKSRAFVHPEEAEGMVTKARACVAIGETFEHETRVRRANGEYRWMFHRKVPFRDADGNIVKWYGSSLDINERKTAEQELGRNAKELQRSEFYLAEGQRLAHWEAGPSIPPASTIGLLSYFECTDSIRPANHLVFRNTWIVLHRIASPWRT